MTHDDAEMILAELAKIGKKLDTIKATTSILLEGVQEDVATVRERVERLKNLSAEERPLNPLGAIQKDPWKRHWETLCARRASFR